jgi:hypothetical protein
VTIPANSSALWLIPRKPSPLQPTSSSITARISAKRHPEVTASPVGLALKGNPPENACGKLMKRFADGPVLVFN